MHSENNSNNNNNNKSDNKTADHRKDLISGRKFVETVTS